MRRANPATSSSTCSAAAGGSRAPPSTASARGSASRAPRSTACSPRSSSGHPTSAISTRRCRPWRRPRAGSPASRPRSPTASRAAVRPASGRSPLTRSPGRPSPKARTAGPSVPSRRASTTAAPCAGTSSAAASSARPSWTRTTCGWPLTGRTTAPARSCATASRSSRAASRWPTSCSTSTRPRQLSALAAILERVEGDLRAAPIAAALRLSILHALGPASRLLTSPGRVAPLRIASGHVKLPGGAHWRERNPWLAFEDGVRLVRGFVQRLESGALGPGPGPARRRPPGPRGGLRDGDAQAGHVRRARRAPAGDGPPRGDRAPAADPAGRRHPAAASRRGAARLGLPHDGVGARPRGRRDAAARAAVRARRATVVGLAGGRASPARCAASSRSLARNAPGGPAARRRRRGVAGRLRPRRRRGRLSPRGARLPEAGRETGGVVELVPPGSGAVPGGARTRANVALPPVPAAPATRTSCAGSGCSRHRSGWSTPRSPRRTRPGPWSTPRSTCSSCAASRSASAGSWARSWSASTVRGTSGAWSGRRRRRDDASRRRRERQRRPARSERRPEPVGDHVERLLTIVRDAPLGGRRATARAVRTRTAGGSASGPTATPPRRRSPTASSGRSTACCRPRARSRRPRSSTGSPACSSAPTSPTRPWSAPASTAIAALPAPRTTCVTTDDLTRRSREHGELVAEIVELGHRLGFSCWIGARQQRRKVGGIPLWERLDDRELAGPPYFGRIRGEDLEDVDVIWYVRGRDGIPVGGRVDGDARRHRAPPPRADAAR